MQEIIKAVKDAQTIAIFPHIMADGDAIGSSLALKEFLDRQGKTTYIIYEEECSYKYQFLFREKQRYIYPDVPVKRDLALFPSTAAT